MTDSQTTPLTAELFTLQDTVLDRDDNLHGLMISMSDFRN